MSSIFIGGRLHPICFNRTTPPFYDISKTKQCRLKNVCIFWFPRDKDGVDLGMTIIPSSFEKRKKPRVKCKRPKTFTERNLYSLIFEGVIFFAAIVLLGKWRWILIDLSVNPVTRITFLGCG